MSIDSCRSFRQFWDEAKIATNKPGFLVLCFKILHENAPDDDFNQEIIGGKIAKFWMLCNKDTGTALKIIWNTSSQFVVGSHLDYMLGIVKRDYKSNSQPKQVSNTGKYRSLD